MGKSAGHNSSTPPAKNRPVPGTCVLPSRRFRMPSVVAVVAETTGSLNGSAAESGSLSGSNMLCRCQWGHRSTLRLSLLFIVISSFPSHRRTGVDSCGSRSFVSKRWLAELSVRTAIPGYYDDTAWYRWHCSRDDAHWATHTPDPCPCRACVDCRRFTPARRNDHWHQ